jgi:hypothetical protein
MYHKQFFDFTTQWYVKHHGMPISTDLEKLLSKKLYAATIKCCGIER